MGQGVAMWRVTAARCALLSGGFVWRWVMRLASGGGAYRVLAASDPDPWPQGTRPCGLWTATTGGWRYLLGSGGRRRWWTGAVVAVLGVLAVAHVSTARHRAVPISYRVGMVASSRSGCSLETLDLGLWHVVSLSFLGALFWSRC